MPDSMYDKLGKLISDAIESGNFFAQKDSEKSSESTQKYTEDSQNEEKVEKLNESNDKTVYKNIHSNNQSQPCIVQPDKKLIKYAHPDVQKACSFIGITDEMSFEDAKKQFHKKLMRYHPDRNADNDVMKKITRQKTGELLKAWETFENWYKG